MQIVDIGIAAKTRVEPTLTALLFYNEKELAERWGVSRRWLKNMRRNRRSIPYHRFGRSIRYEVTVVRHYEEIMFYIPPVESYR